MPTPTVAASNAGVSLARAQGKGLSFARRASLRVWTGGSRAYALGVLILQGVWHTWSGMQPFIVSSKPLSSLKCSGSKSFGILPKSCFLSFASLTIRPAVMCIAEASEPTMYSPNAMTQETTPGRTPDGSLPR